MMFASIDGDAYPLTYDYDTTGRRTSLSTTRNGTIRDVTSWTYDPATGLNTAKRYPDGSRIGYAYTDNGRRTRTTWARGVRRETAYDSIGNATFASVGSATNTYVANCLNQYVAVSSDGVTIEPVYDVDGNLVSFGDWAYAYDSSARLTEVRSNGVLVASNYYDHQGRRVRLVTSEESYTFVYDGWNVVLELVDHDGVMDRIEYYWGRDLSGTFQGAGGVGGLLYLKRNGSIFVPLYDANGNVMEYRAADGALAASYVYDAFGRTVSKSGPFADVFRYRHATKSFERETGLYYYGKRFYSVALRRWLNRDPLEEEGGVNLYQYCMNDALLYFDYVGLTSVSISMKTEFMEGRLGKSEFIAITVTTLEKPDDDAHLNFIQLKKNDGGRWSVDCSGTLGPYYYNRMELKRFSSRDDKGNNQMTLYDSPGGAITADVMFYVAVVEVKRSCAANRYGSIHCYDQVQLLDSRTWTYHPGSVKRYSYENKSRGKGMLPTLRELINKCSWRTELCSNTKVEVK